MEKKDIKFIPYWEFKQFLFVINKNWLKTIDEQKYNNVYDLSLFILKKINDQESLDREYLKLTIALLIYWQLDKIVKSELRVSLVESILVVAQQDKSELIKVLPEAVIKAFNKAKEIDKNNTILFGDFIKNVSQANLTLNENTDEYLEEIFVKSIQPRVDSSTTSIVTVDEPAKESITLQAATQRDINVENKEVNDLIDKEIDVLRSSIRNIENSLNMHFFELKPSVNISKSLLQGSAYLQSDFWKIVDSSYFEIDTLSADLTIKLISGETVPTDLSFFEGILSVNATNILMETNVSFVFEEYNSSNILLQSIPMTTINFDVVDLNNPFPHSFKSTPFNLSTDFAYLKIKVNSNLSIDLTMKSNGTFINYLKTGENPNGSIIKTIYNDLELPIGTKVITDNGSNAPFNYGTWSLIGQLLDGQTIIGANKGISIPGGIPKTLADTYNLHTHNISGNSGAGGIDGEADDIADYNIDSETAITSNPIESNSNNEWITGISSDNNNRAYGLGVGTTFIWERTA